MMLEIAIGMMMASRKKKPPAQLLVEQQGQPKAEAKLRRNRDQHKDQT